MARHASPVQSLLVDDRFDGDVYAHEPLSRHTTYRIGGPARFFVRANSVGALTGLVDVCAAEGTPWVVLGRGSNVLVADGGFPGVAIARALSIGPDAIIADEPTSALDVSVRAQILNLLTDLKKELGLAMVFISHDIQTVRYVSDRIAVMNRGVVVEEGPAAQLLADPYEPYTRELLGAAPSLLHPNLDLEGEY